MVKGCIVLTAVILVAVLTACGGGGGGNSGETPNAPAGPYRGVTTQAVVTSENAATLALNGFEGSMLVSGIGLRSTSGLRTTSVNESTCSIRQLIKVIKQSARKMDLPRAVKEKAKSARSSGLMKFISRSESFQIPGDSSGYASYELDINDSTGSFTGSVDYHDYASQGVVISGTAKLLGTFDANRQDINNITISFENLSMRSGGFSIALIGSLSWTFNYSASSDSLTVNVFLIDQADGKTHWFNNYEIATKYSNGYLTQTLSGRYYHPDYGFVDFITRTPLMAVYGDSWPSQGFLKFSGGSGTWVTLDFFPRTLSIDADTNGDGTMDWQADFITNDQPDPNSPPKADAGPDQNVLQGATVSLNGSASSDPNGDALSYSWTFQSCPQNKCPALTGSNTSVPSFLADRTGVYVVGLTVYDGQSASAADTVTITVAPVVPSDPTLLQLKWQYGIFGTGIGRAGLHISDLDGDGIPEIIASASLGQSGINSLWYILRHAADGSFEQIWRSHNYPAPIVRLALADITGDAKEDVIIALADGTIRIYDGPTRQEIKSLKAAATLTAIAIADLDGDGKQEIVTSDGTGVFVYSPESGGLKWSIPTGGGTSIAVGNVDTDAALEIVTTTNGGKGYVIDGVSKSIEWVYVNSFGAQVALGDIDGDGMKEIVAASGWQKITVFDADRKTPVWEIVTALDIGALLVADADGDGVPEIIYGDGQWGKIRAIDARTQKEKWTINNPDHGVSGIALGDADRDGKVEVLWGSGGTSSGPNRLYVVDPLTGTVKWQSVHIDGPLNAMSVGDLDGDGEDEIVMISHRSDSDYGEGIIHIFSARTHALKYQNKLGTTDWMGVHSARIGDVDGDGKTEFIVTTANTYAGVIRVYDGTTHALKRQSAGYSGNFFTALAIGDVDKDGKIEIVAGQGREHTGAQGTYLIVFDGVTMQEKWRSVDLGSYWGSVYDVKLSDLDGDGHPEIIASLSGSGSNVGKLIVFDGVSHVLKLLIEHPARALEVADIDSDGALEILVGREDGIIDAFDGKIFALKKSFSTFSNAPVDALLVADLGGGGSSDWLVTSGGVLAVLKGQGQGLKWRSGDLSSGLGLYNHLSVRDTNGNGRKEIFLGSSLALYQFE